MFRSCIYFLVCIVIVSCGNNASDRKDGFSAKPESPADSLFHVVMEGHDAAMAKMGKLNNYKDIARRKIDSLEPKVSGKSKVLLDSLKTIRVDLDAAEQLMNDWMERFNVDSAQNRSAEGIKYLEDQKDKVDVVKTRIADVLAKADSLLKR
jgi:hypothetical protein